MHKTQNHAQVLLGLGVLAAALWAAVSGWLLLGGQSFAVTLEDRAGDPAALRGFTVAGVLSWNYGGADQRFNLHDGYLDTELCLNDFSVLESIDDASVWSWRYYTVPPQDHEAVDRKAVASRGVSDPFARLDSTTDTLRRMYELSLPDGTRLRLFAGDVASPESAVSASDYAFNEIDTSYDYQYQGDISALEAGWPESPVADQPFRLGEDTGLCWSQPMLDRQPGLYRAEGLTFEQITALPRDGEVYGRPVLRCSTEFGTLEPFYCPEDARLALAGASMTDDTALLLYLNGENLLCADLVDADGVLLDHTELAELPEDVTLQATRMPRNNDREVLIKVTAIQEDGSADTGASTRMVVLRVKDGAFVLHQATPCSINVDAAYLNAEGNALLLTDEAAWDILPSRTMDAVSEGISLTVRPLDSTLATYQGLLRTGGERDWATLIHYDSSLTRRQVHFTTIEKDRG